MHPQEPALDAAISGVVPVSGQAWSTASSSWSSSRPLLRLLPLLRLMGLPGPTLLLRLLLSRSRRAASFSLCPARRKHKSEWGQQPGRRKTVCYWVSSPFGYAPCSANAHIDSSSSAVAMSSGGTSEPSFDEARRRFSPGILMAVLPGRFAQHDKDIGRAGGAASCGKSAIISCQYGAPADGQFWKLLRCSSKVSK